MGQAGFVLIGIVAGLLGSVPSGVLFERALRGRQVSVGVGLLSVLASFALLVAAVFVVWLLHAERTLVFGGVMAGTFLAVWAVEAWRAWRDANASSSPEEGKSGEPTR